MYVPVQGEHNIHTLSRICIRWIFIHNRFVGKPAVDIHSAVVINEVNADTPDVDTHEFVELFDGGRGSTPLAGLALVFFDDTEPEKCSLWNHQT